MAGSSPLARGLLLGAEGGEFGAGIIPARAGFTKVPVVYQHNHEDHPRSRGVYGSFVTGQDRIPGSSPLARGLPGRSP